MSITFSSYERILIQLSLGGQLEQGSSISIKFSENDFLIIFSHGICDGSQKQIVSQNEWCQLN